MLPEVTEEVANPHPNLPAVASSPKKSGVVTGTRGLRASSLLEALKQRAEVAEEENEFFESDGTPLSSDDECADAQESPRQAVVGMAGVGVDRSANRGHQGLKAAIGNALDPRKNILDSAPCAYAEAKDALANHAKLLSGAETADGSHGGIRGHPSRRLIRLRSEAEALIAWSEASSLPMGDAPASWSGAAVARQARRQAAELDEVVRGAVASSGRNLGQHPGAMWLPPPQRTNTTMVQQLLRLSALSPHTEAIRHSDDEERTIHQGEPQGGFCYELSGVAGNAGWQGSAQAEELAALETRMRRVRALLGHEGTAGGAPLASTASRLHRQLRALQSLETDFACSQLMVSVRMLSAELDFLIEEEKMMHERDKEANTEEVRALIQDKGAEEQIDKLHARLSPLVDVARRVVNLGQQLEDHEGRYAELCTFAQDLAGAEARMSHAEDLLKTTAEVARCMKASSDKGLEQLQRNIALIEMKLHPRVGRLPAVTMPC